MKKITFKLLVLLMGLMAWTGSAQTYTGGGANIPSSGTSGTDTYTVNVVESGTLGTNYEIANVTFEG